MPQGHHHHENKRDKANTRALQYVKREREKGAVVHDRPIAVIDIGEERISEIIKEVIGENEDKYQDAWCKILVSNCKTEDDIRNIVIEVKNINPQPLHKFPEHSFQKPLSYSDSKSLTLEDVIASPQLVFDEPEPIEKRKRKDGRAYLYRQKMDEEVAGFLRSKYPGVPLRHALRMALGLPTKDTKRWKTAEIDILKKLYLENSIDSIAVTLGRTSNAVKLEAFKLGLKRIGHSRVTPRGCFNREDLLKIFHMSGKHLDYLLSNGLFKWCWHKNIKIYHRSDIIEFIRKVPFKYRHDLLEAGWESYIPDDLRDWVTLKEAAKLVHWSHYKIRRMIKNSQMPVRYYGKGRGSVTYVNLEVLKDYLEIEEVGQPYKVVSGFIIQNAKYVPPISAYITHYTFQDKDGEWVLACSPTIPVVSKYAVEVYGAKPRFIIGYPTCKRCQSMLKKYRENHKNTK